MPKLVATPEQFELDENRVTHVPTGAWWSAYPKSGTPSLENWGKAGDVLANGDEYDQHQIKHVALTLLSNRPGVSPA